MSKLSCWILLISCTCVLLAGGITPAGNDLASRYDALNVEQLWLPGHYVNWRTGEPDQGKSGKTHCSAFAAAACDRLGIYLLHPPEHGLKNLANAQARWLAEVGNHQGWIPIESSLEAQRLANEGQVVVAVFPNPDPLKPGHIALVRPSDKAASALRTEGPQIIQAGQPNDASTSVKHGFRHHPGAWTNASTFQLRFYVHPLPGKPTQ